jgi:hypothetical protein
LRTTITHFVRREFEPGIREMRRDAFAHGVQRRLVGAEKTANESSRSWR